MNPLLPSERPPWNSPCQDVHSWWHGSITAAAISIGSQKHQELKTPCLKNWDFGCRLIWHKGWDPSQLMYTPTADLGINYSHWGVNSSHPRKKAWEKVDELHPKGTAFSPLTIKVCDRDRLWCRCHYGRCLKLDESFGFLTLNTWPKLVIHTPSTVGGKEILLEDVTHVYLTGGLNCLPVVPIFILLSIGEV